MPSNIIRKNGYLRDSETGCISDKVISDNPEENKVYAAILRCGHCGDGYFIPIMFTAKAKDVYSAIETVKTNPRVQRQKKDVVLAAFEITELEQYFIETVNNHDPYLKGWHLKGNDQILDRRVYSDNEEHSINKRYNRRLDDRNIKVADDYRSYYVLERFFAPRMQGDNIVPASRKINRDELMREYFTQNTIRHGMKKGNAFFLALYYQQYGKNNDLGLEYYNGYITFMNDGKRWTYEVKPEAEIRLDQKVKEEAEQERLQKQEEEKFLQKKGKATSSAIDRFNNRMQRHNEKKSKLNSSEGETLEEAEPGL